MRASSLGFAVISLLSVGVFQAAGCGSDSTGSGGGGTTSGGDDPCNPAKIEKCKIARDVPSDCVALFDYTKSSTPTLRMAQIVISEPAALVSPLVKNILDSGITINLPDCNIGDDSAASMAGNFNWLLQFDLPHGKLKTGGAKPIPDPLKGYSFAGGTIKQNGNVFDIKPVEIDIVVKSDGSFTDAKGLDLVVPIYQDKQGATAILLPLHAARIESGTISADHNCIGSFDSKDLTPNFNCKTNEPYISGGTIDGFITLEEADTVDIPTAHTTLCAIIAGMAGMPKCPRSHGDIDFVGNWCSKTNTKDGCKDAVKLIGEFAASAVKLND